jgi:hypothetical protein
MPIITTIIICCCHFQEAYKCGSLVGGLKLVINKPKKHIRC